MSSLAKANKREAASRAAERSKKKQKKNKACGTESYWDQAATEYDAEIVDNLDQSITFCAKQNKISPLVAAVTKYRNKSLTAVDFGCGPGRHLPLLSEHFNQIIGIDISAPLLDLAQAHTDGTIPDEDLKLHHFDLGRKELQAPQVQTIRSSFAQVPRFAICTNVLIMPQERLWSNILKNIKKVLSIPESIVVFLVPSLESALFVQQRFKLWDSKAARQEGIPTVNKKSAMNLLEGIIPRDDVPHKVSGLFCFFKFNVGWVMCLIWCFLIWCFFDLVCLTIVVVFCLCTDSTG